MIRVKGSSFIDEQGRTLMLRGVNLGGSSKVPRVPDGATHLRDGFLDHHSVSFIARPFPLEMADEHFGRLRSWGMTFLRFLITWEAVEHAGPGIYDDDYIAYVHAVVEKAGAHGISLFIDSHQDVWSRWTGGDGAPGWTLEAVGFDPGALDETGAAFTHQGHGDPFPRVTWPANSGKLATATMFTLFFGGNLFAPTVLIDGEPSQDYLQRHYIDAISHVARRLRDLPNVVGYGTMNEPLPGYIGWKDLRTTGGLVTLGACPTGLQGMALGDGIPQVVSVWRMRATRIAREGAVTVNEGRRRAWRDGRECIWRRSGVWDVDDAGQPRLLKPHYFAEANGRAVEFARDFYKPFAGSFHRAISAVHPGARIFIETEAFAWPPDWAAGDAADFVFAPHWYDELVLAKRRYLSFVALEFTSHKVALGRRAIRRAFARQLAWLQQGARERLGGAPVLLGEFGIPFDLHGRDWKAGNTRQQERALDRSYRAVEDSLLSCTLWNYTADNTHERGDQWNGEDFSIYCRDVRSDSSDADSGARAARAFQRPYPVATAGLPLSVEYDMRRGRFRFRFRHDPSVDVATEIFLPRQVYGRGCRVTVSDGTWELEPETQILLYRHDPRQSEHEVRVAPRQVRRKGR